MSSQYDAIVIGTGAGGGTLAMHLALAGKNILILERGPFLPQEKLNWDTSAVFLDNRYHTKEVWQNKEGQDLHPQQAYYVGGQTKVYGAAMFRMRAEDFGVIRHQGGISPAWPISYADLEPYYTRAEELFHVHGDLGSAPSVPGGFGSSFDPTEPFHSKPYPYPALSNEPRMQTIEDDVRRLGVHTFPIPLGLKRNEADPVASKCARCDTCDGYPCLVHAKSDADINCIREIMHLSNVTLMTNTRVTRLLTNATGTAVTAVEVIHSGPGSAYGNASEQSKSDALSPSRSDRTATYTAGIFALCAGAINSAVVLLASANEKHPNGLGNRSDQVGRNFMYHQADALLALSTQRNEDAYTKTWGTNDFYLKDSDPAYPFPLGQVQPVGSFHHEMMKGDAPPLTPGFVLETMKHHAVPWWLTTEDLPDPENRVTLHNTTPLSVEDVQPGVVGAHPSGDTGQTNQSEPVTTNAPHRIQLAYMPNNVKSFDRLKERWVDVLKKAGHATAQVPLHAYFKKRIPLEGVGHQNGTCRMGEDPSTNVLDVHCKVHDLDNLYVVDASCFVSASAVNPSLTIIANAIRVSEHLLQERLR
ncbi:GMC family oxidoreductase [Tunturiibacter empetritectus]|uniref:Choline dehydrogenase-like flavoprotein n=1 Tax=Tunturiibacter lichenicola TaxID=2051959 RepID=A0A852VJH0_9BACT|nr:GMC family oxidoreductase [Edaphobacter lichenicola]NYF89656.1 choline dehydrogenase-like flavoprotein [Edaphobacter lichenicola]